MKSVNYFILIILIIIGCHEIKDFNNSEYHNRIIEYNNRKDFLTTDNTIILGLDLPKIKIIIQDSLITLPINQNQYLLLNLWFRECAACIKEIPIINEINDMENIDVISLCRSKREEFNDLSILDSIKYPVSFDNSFIIDSVLLWPYGYPSNILIDKNGKIEKVFYQIQRNSKGFNYLSSLN